jgi:hypothetical protein
MPQDESATAASARGGCLCGAVEYEVRGALRPVVYCHCRMCRRSSGHFVAATACAREQLVLRSAHGLRWYASSQQARRGFCAHCGSNLFWEQLHAPYVSIMAGTLDETRGLTAHGHIFVADAGDYYAIADGLPQSPGWGHLPALAPEAPGP